MFAKVTVLAAFLASCHAGVLVDSGHGQATSSQSIIRHDQPSQHIQALHQPIAQYTPLVHESHVTAPLIQQQSFVHSAPLVHQQLVQQPLVHKQLIQQPLVHQQLVQQPLVHQQLVQQPLVHQQLVQQPLVQSHYQAPYQTLGLGHYATAAHSSPVIQNAPVVHAAPVAAKIIAPVHAQHIEEYAPAHYEFSYSVADPHTGDQKSQHESRDGDVVKGEYSLVQPDGSIRKVEYSADDHSGFSAIVHQSAVHAAPAHSAAPALHAAPLLAYNH